MYIQKYMNKSYGRIGEVLKEFSNVHELEKVIRQIDNLREKGWEITKITENLFNVDKEKDEFDRYRMWVSRVINRIKRHSIDEAINFYREKYILLERQEEEKEKGKKRGRPQKPVEEKLLDASKSAVERKLLEHIRKISLEQLREIIENGLLVKEYEEQIRQEVIEQYKKLYIKERARRELLNEGLFMFLSGLIDRRTLAQLILSIAFDELFEPKLIPLSYAPGGEENGREETSD